MQRKAAAASENGEEKWQWQRKINGKIEMAKNGVAKAAKKITAMAKRAEMKENEMKESGVAKSTWRKGAKLWRQ